MPSPASCTSPLAKLRSKQARRGFFRTTKAGSSVVARTRQQQAYEAHLKRMKTAKQTAVAAESVPTAKSTTAVSTSVHCKTVNVSVSCSAPRFPSRRRANRTKRKGPTWQSQSLPLHCLSPAKSRGRPLFGIKSPRWMKRRRQSTAKHVTHQKEQQQQPPVHRKPPQRKPSPSRRKRAMGRMKTLNAAMKQSTNDCQPKREQPASKKTTKKKKKSGPGRVRQLGARVTRQMKSNRQSLRDLSQSLMDKINELTKQLEATQSETLRLRTRFASLLTPTPKPKRQRFFPSVPYVYTGDNESGYTSVSSVEEDVVVENWTHFALVPMVDCDFTVPLSPGILVSPI